MSSTYTSTINITSARFARGYVEAWVSSQTDTTATIYWRILCQQKSAALYGQVANCYVDGIGRGSCSGYITSSSSSWKDVCSTSGYTTVNKTTSSRNVPVTVQTRVQPVNGYGSVTSGYVESTCYVSISAKTSYTISYDANGGSGAPSSQTKWYDTALTLSSTTPTRTGYSFNNWNTASDGTGTSYASGASYTDNAALTLYAQWTAHTYTVSYNANGGSGAPSSQTKTYGVDLTLSSTKPTRTNYNFLGWATSSTGSVAYAAGATYSANSAVTLYAVWELAYWKPKITNLTATRCDSDGTANEYGTYAKITFNWELCQLIGTNTTATIAISWTGSSASVTGSGASGTVSKVVGSGALSIESPYTFTVKVTDNTDNTSLDVTLPASSFAIDFKAGGTGVNFGAPAEDDGFNCAWNAYFNETLSASGLTARDTLDVGGGAELGTTLSSSATHGGYIDFHYQGSTADYTTRIIEESSGTLGVKGAIQATGSISTANYVSLGSHNASGDFRSLALINTSSNTYFGHGSYTNSEGSTYYEGNTVGIQAKGNIYMTAPSAGLSARAYGVNKVLWSGAWYMKSDHTITLSEAVSAQPNGIVLVFSEYSSTANDQWFSHHFVSKYHVATHNGNGSTFFSCGAVGSMIHMNKYLYISDTSISGYVNNNASMTMNGITVTNGRYVLRYVIGV